MNSSETCGGLVVRCCNVSPVHKKNQMDLYKLAY